MHKSYVSFALINLYATVNWVTNRSDNFLSPVRHKVINWSIAEFGSDNGDAPVRTHALIWTRAKLLPLGPLGTKCNETLIRHTAGSVQEYIPEYAVAKWRTFYRTRCVNYSSLPKLINVLNHCDYLCTYIPRYLHIVRNSLCHSCSSLPADFTHNF